MGNKPNHKREKFNSADLIMAYQVATEYFLRRREDGGLEKQNKIAEEMGMAAPRFSEFLDIAWRAGIVNVIITPPEGGSSDFRELRNLELKLTEKLKRFSPPLVDEHGKNVRDHKLVRIHVVSSITHIDLDSGSKEDDESKNRSSVTAHICSRAAKEFYSLLKEAYHKHKQEGREPLYCGIGWSRTCERILNLLQFDTEHYPDLVVCPLIGIMGHKETPLDSNFLAFRLASILSGTSIKLPCPCLRPPDLNLEVLRPVKRALEEISQCKIGISGIAPAYYPNRAFHATPLARKMIDEEQFERIKKLGGVAEISCHYFDINGRSLPHQELGFVPVGVTVEQMQRMPRFMIVVSPEKEKILPAIVAIKSGICSDLVLSQKMAQHILDREHEEELRLRPEDGIR